MLIRIATVYMCIKTSLTPTLHQQFKDAVSVVCVVNSDSGS